MSIGMRLALLVAGLAFGIAPAQAAPLCDGTDACLQALAASQRATRVLSARFVQTKHLSLLAEPLVSRGRFAFKPPDEILWAVDDPKVTVRIDRQGVHLPDLPNAEAELHGMAPFSEMMREMSGVFTGSLSGARERFEVEARAEGEAIHVHLVPRSAQWRRTFSAIDLTFGPPDLTMRAIHLDEALGDSLEIVFSDIHRNDAAARAAFAAEGAAHE